MNQNTSEAFVFCVMHSQLGVGRGEQYCGETKKNKDIY